ncbi:hypothetical protein [Thiocapsa marina]|uniref:Uncharacterized protein n=1 Tax=Thiocapsa marina 5811 TaxID=768671 RepID=F9UHQ7_9GAMM|nr:hypothetical protein [Thiocapsa marina]EGV16233.1 hypothetical protein ThimaDRAFT_4460 [Thiocapsa marina 5811]
MHRTPAMRDDDLERVWKPLLVAARKLPPTGSGFDSLMARALDAFAGTSIERFPTASELALPVALSLLGLDTSAPPAEVVATLQHHMAAAPAAHPLDVVTAYGCGWARRVAPTATGWDGRWDRAQAALHALVARFVGDAAKQLERAGIRFPYEPDTAFAADLLIIRLYRPLSTLPLDEAQALYITCTEDGAQVTCGEDHEELIPAGAKAVYDVRHDKAGPPRLRRGENTLTLAPDHASVLRVTAMDLETRITLTAGNREKTLKLAPSEILELAGPVTLDVLECTCGHWRCAERHRLSGWQPDAAEISLASFVASAVKGPGRTLRTGTFPQGMLFALWSREGF